MGYILPITHFVYKNYQSRMPRGDERPFYIDKTFPVNVVKQNITANLANKKIDVPPEERKKEEKKKAPKLTVHESELLEKGHFINEQV